MTAFGPKQSKWGKPKQLWYSNVQTFFDKVMTFGFLGDEVLNSGPADFADPCQHNTDSQLNLLCLEGDKKNNYAFIRLFL